MIETSDEFLTTLYKCALTVGNRQLPIGDRLFDPSPTT